MRVGPETSEPGSRGKILPTAATGARWMAWVGLGCGVLYSFGGLVVDLLTIGLNWGTAMAFGALVGMPVLFAAAGFLGGALVAVVVGIVRSTVDG